MAQELMMMSEQEKSPMPQGPSLKEMCLEEKKRNPPPPERVAVRLEEYPQPTNTRDSEWDRDYVTVMTALQNGTLPAEMIPKARELLAHMLVLLGNTIVYCPNCMDDENVETGKGSWVRCPDCR